MFRQYDLEGLVHHTDEVLEVTRRTAYLRMAVRTFNTVCTSLRRRKRQLKDGADLSEVRDRIFVPVLGFKLGDAIPNKISLHMSRLIKILKDHGAAVEPKDHDFEFEGHTFKAQYLVIENLDNIDQAGLLRVQLEARVLLRERT